MINCSCCKVILKKSQTKGSRTQSTGASPSPSSSFSPLFKSPGAGDYQHRGLLNRAWLWLKLERTFKWRLDISSPKIRTHPLGKEACYNKLDSPPCFTKTVRKGVVTRAEDQLKIRFTK